MKRYAYTYCDWYYKSRRRIWRNNIQQSVFFRCFATSEESAEEILTANLYRYTRHYDIREFTYFKEVLTVCICLHRATWWRCFFHKHVRRHFMSSVFLFFVTEPDPDKANKQYGEPVLASAGRDPEDSWRMLASNRQRMTGEPQDAEKLKREMTAEGYHVEKYQATPL